MAEATEDLTLTGERTLPGIARENYWFRRHEAAYLALAAHCRDAVVLEAGAGEGYGAAILLRTARAVVAVDYDESAVRHLVHGYPDVPAVRANLVHLPVADRAVDVVATLQVVEHLWDQPAFVAECARVLPFGGRLVMTTPNRLTFSPGLAAPLNPFHTRELDPREIVDLLAPHFDVTLTGLRHGARLAGLDRRHGGLVRAQLACEPALWGAELTADVVSVTAADFDLTDSGIDSSLDLVAVARRR